jgi:hypothetical protein
MEKTVSRTLTNNCDKWICVACVILLCFPAFGQATYSGAGRYSGAGAYGIPGQVGVGVGENAYCPAGVGAELTEGTPTWGTTDAAASLPTHCVNTALASTPSGTHVGGGAATTYTPADATALTALLNGSSLQCGDTIQLTAGSTYSASSFTFPAPACDGGHWITVKSSGVSNGAFPAEGVRATPCIAGLSNDAGNGRSLPGYPDYPCSSYPTVLTAKINGTATNNPPVQFASGANHYRFIGIEVTKTADVEMGGSLAQLAADGQTMGANHIVWDRSIIHGQPWTLASGIHSETQGGVKANNSRWVAVVNSWIYDTYCVAGCVDSQTFSAGTGVYQDGPFKLYNNLLATSGETYLFGGGGQGVGTPNTRDFEFRANHSFKNLQWMIPMETCPLYNAVTPKNLGEFKNMTFALLEGNFFENVWQGCQSDQLGYANAFYPGNQNNHQAMSVNFDGSNVVQAADSNSFSHNNGTPDDAANCPPGGCILEIADAGRTDNGAQYRFCDGANGCDQAGMNLTTQARLTSAPDAGSSIGVNACVPGDCPSCKVENITYRLNEIYNATNGLIINTGASSHCRDESAGMDHVSIHDNLWHGLSREMSNGSDPYQMSLGISMSNGQVGAIINSVEFAHNTLAIETGNSLSSGGLGTQIDHTDRQYLQGLNIHDNVSPAVWMISHGSGSFVTKGIGGLTGLANTYATASCQKYYPNEAPGGLVVAGNLSSFTFSPVLASYLVTVNGQSQTLSASTSSSFTLTTAASAEDAITVRDLNTCSWTFTGNLLGTGLPGSAKPYDPYPASNNTNCGVSGTANCILDGSAFTSLFASWGTGRTGDFSITSSAYRNSATDAATRSATGKDPGADFTRLGQATQGVRGATYYPALTITTTSLPSATVGTAYQASLQASAGASPYKGWWLETDPAQCGGSCGSLPDGAGIIIGRSGVVNGPFIVYTVSRTANVSKFLLQQTTVTGAPQVGQVITLSGFVNGTGTQQYDGSFNGTCTISSISGNNFFCPQTGVDVASHAPKDASVVSFAPVTAGAYTFWVGARDGAFQAARGAVALTVN